MAINILSMLNFIFILMKFVLLVLYIDRNIMFNWFIVRKENDFDSKQQDNDKTIADLKRRIASLKSRIESNDRSNKITSPQTKLVVASSTKLQEKNLERTQKSSRESELDNLRAKLRKK